MRKSIVAALSAASLLSACGGGGGSSSTTPPDVPASTKATVTLTGVAAKGLMAHADVNVYGVNPDGSLAAAALASTTTDSTGHYSLSFAGNQGEPVVIKVSAKADGTTTHSDEVSGVAAQPLPAGFVMRALLVPASTGAITTSASITPFSELAVAAAAKASGGITASNAQQALSTVTQMLGFDPRAVTATSTATASSADEQKLAVMLTAVSQLANSGALGCTSGSAGDKTKCVVDALGAAASATSIKLSSTSGGNSTDVSAALSAAVGTVLTNPVLAKTIDSALLTTVVTNLGCASVSACAAAPANTPPPVNAAATAITGAKLLFAEMKSDWLGLFSQGAASAIATGPVNIQAFKFKTAMDGVQVPAEVLVKDVGTLLMGIDLYNDYKAGRSTSPNRGRGEANLVANDGSVSGNQAVPAGCTLYQDADTSLAATSTANANFIGCGARFYASRSVTGNTTVTTEWRHGFTVTPKLDGSFDYSSRARRRVNSCTAGSCTVTGNVPLQTDGNGVAIAPFTGTVTPVLSAAFGDINTVTIVGELPAAFKSGDKTLLGYKHSLNVSGSQTQNPDNTISSVLTGSVVAKNSSGVVQNQLTLKKGRIDQAPISVDVKGDLVKPGSGSAVAPAGHDVSGFELDLVFGTPTAEFEGLLSVTGATWDTSGRYRVPSDAKLSGALRTLSAGVATEFLSGAFSLTSTGYGSFNNSLPSSPSNSYTIGASFVGTVTAPGRPVLEITLAASQLMDTADGGGTPKGATMQYRTLVDGKPRLVVSVTGSVDPVTHQINKFTLTESSANLGMSWMGGASTVDLLYGGSLKIGSVNLGNGLITFSDSSFVSLDVGL